MAVAWLYASPRKVDARLSMSEHFCAANFKCLMTDNKIDKVWIMGRVGLQEYISGYEVFSVTIIGIQILNIQIRFLMSFKYFSI